VLERWKEYFQNLLSIPIVPERPQLISEGIEDHEKLAPSTYNEICSIINKLKTDKAAGTDNIQGELIKYGGRTLRQKIHTLILNIWISLSSSTVE
jgi:hypothetical protein